MNDRTAIFTICSNNYLPQAEVFFATARDHHPDAEFVLGLADAPGDLPYPPGVAVLPARDLAIPDFPSVAFGYDIMEFNTAIKPFIFLNLLERGFARVLYFDPDIMLFRRLGDILATLDRGASFVLTPHLCKPPGPGAPRTEIDVMRTGIYNLGFLGVSPHRETEPILRWWARKLRHDCVNDQTGGVFVDQKFMDFVPGFADHARVLRDPTLNVAYWNVAQRVLEHTADGWSVDGRPLGFFHFSGFDPAKAHVLSKHAPAAPVGAALAGLLGSYAERMRARAAHPGSASPYAYGAFASGNGIPDPVRRMFRHLHLAWSGDPFENYEAYAALPWRHAATGDAGEVVSNFMGYVHSRSDELRHRFDLGRPRQVSAFVRWFAEEARRNDWPAALWGEPRSDA